MSFLYDTYCQLCERFITKEQWNQHLYYSRLLHKKSLWLHTGLLPIQKVDW